MAVRQIGINMPRCVGGPQIVISTAAARFIPVCERGGYKMKPTVILLLLAFAVLGISTPATSQQLALYFPFDTNPLVS